MASSAGSSCVIMDSHRCWGEGLPALEQLKRQGLAGDHQYFNTSILPSVPMTWQQTRPLARAHSLPLQLFGETFIPEMPTFLPNTRAWRPEQGPMVELEPELSDVERAGAAFKLTFGEDPATDQGPWRQHTCADYRRAYASGQSTPSQVAERVITAVAASEEQVRRWEAANMCRVRERALPPRTDTSCDKGRLGGRGNGQLMPSPLSRDPCTQDPAMCLFTEFDPDKVRAAAAASTERWRNGSPLSPLDGVPFGVKDLVDVLGYKTTAGTSWMADWWVGVGLSRGKVRGGDQGWYRSMNTHRAARLIIHSLLPP